VNFPLPVISLGSSRRFSGVPKIFAILNPPPLHQLLTSISPFLPMMSFSPKHIEPHVQCFHSLCTCRLHPPNHCGFLLPSALGCYSINQQQPSSLQVYKNRIVIHAFPKILLV